MKVWISLFLLFFISLTAAVAQPANDNCSSATPLPLSTGATCTPGIFTNVGATTQGTDPVAPICWGPATLSHNVWFSFVPTTSAVTITTSDAGGAGALANTQLAVYTGTCGSLIQLACNENISAANLHAQVTATALTPGTTYYIMVDGNTNLTGTFGICVQSISQPNDNCANAIPLTVGSNACTPATYSNLGATAQTTDPTPACWSPAIANHNVWFSFTPASTQVQVSTNFFGSAYSLTNTQTAVYSGTCGTLTQIACSEDIGPGNSQTQFLVSGLTPGITYYIMVDGNTNTQGSFGICVQNVTLTNDNCATAIALPVTTGSCNSPVYTNVGSTSVGDPTAACWATTPNNSVWFSFTPTATTSVEISSNFNGPAFTLANTQVAVYSGTCTGTLTYLACDEDINTTNGFLHTNFQMHGLTIGTTYYIMVDGNGTSTGTFGICVQSIPPPPPAPVNNNCATATPIIPGCNISVPNGIVPGSNTTFTPSCFGNGTTQGMVNPWMYTFTAATSGTIGFTVTPNSPTDFDVAMFNITNGCPIGAGGTAGGSGAVQVGCDWLGSTGVTGFGCATPPASPCPAMPSITAGQTYLIIIDRFTSSSTSGFTLAFPGSAQPAVPTPSFTFTPACTGSPVQFTNTTPGATTTANSWTFGDGSTSTAVSPSHTYAAAGTYSVTLTTTVSCGTGPTATSFSNSTTQLVTVSDPPFANFSVTSPVCVGQPSTIQYTGPALSGATYNWTFDGGTIVSGTGPGPYQVTWPTAGTKNVTLQINLGSCTTPVNTLLVEVLPVPTVTVTPATSAICSGQNVTLLASGASTYSWAPAPGLVTPATTASVSVSPPSQQIYTVYGTAPNGCVSTGTATVNVDIFQLLFLETMGTVPATTPIAFHETNNGFDNDQLTMSGTGDVRATLASTGYPGASGGANIFLNFMTATVTPVFEIAGMNTLGMSNLQLSFGVYKNSSASLGAELIVEASDNGGPWIVIGSPALAAGIGWQYTTLTGPFPASSNMAIRFRQNATNIQWRIDDVLLRNPWAAPTITASGPLNICPGQTLNLTASGANNFSWSNGLTSQIITVTTAGTYTVTVSDVNNCVKTSDPVVVTTSGVPSPVASSNSPLCAGQTLQLNSTGDPSLAYNWTGPNSFTSNLQNPTLPNVQPVNAGTYVVTINSTACGTGFTVSDSTVVTLSTGTTSFTYPASSYCISSGATPVPTVAAGATGTFTSTPAGLVINSSTGEVTVAGSTAGTYTINFTTSGPCPATATQQLTIQASPSAVFAYSDPAYCQSSTATPVPTTAAGVTGTFTASPTGLTLNSTSGQVTPATSTPGIYTISFTTSGPCSASSTQQLEILAAPSAAFSYPSATYCVTGAATPTPTIASGATGTFSASPAGLLLDASTGQITVTGSVPGCYTISFTTSGPCPATATQQVCIVTSPSADFSYSAPSYCSNSTPNPAPVFASGASGGSFTAFPGGLSLNSSTGVINLAASSAGVYNVVNTIAASGGCAPAADTTQVTILAAPLAPSLANSGPVCTGAALTVSVNNPLAGATYNWTGPAGTPASGTSFSYPTTAAGNLSFSATVTSAEGCTSSTTGTTTAIVNAIPATPVLSSNAVCAGQTLVVSVTNPAAGGTYAWTGPNGPVGGPGSSISIPASNTTHSGTYSAVVTVSGCSSSSGSVVATVNPSPAAPVPTSNSPVCGGGTLELYASAIPNATYSWSGPGSYTSLLQNPTRPNATAAMSGTYTVWSFVSGCQSAMATTQVTVSAIPSAPVLSSNSPICAGQPLELQAQGVAGATFNWTAPGGATFTGQTVTIPAASVTAHNGIWTATQTINGCLSSAGALQVAINGSPNAPNIISNSPVCQGQTLILSTTLVPGSTYTWTTPNGMNHVGQILTITNAQPSDSGLYSLVTYFAGCPSPVATYNAIVGSTPLVPAIFSNSPVCAGQTLTLSTTAVAGATYAWTAPNGNTYQTQTVTIPGTTPTTTAYSGLYTLTVTSNYGCASAASTAPVTVNPVPAQPFLSSNSPVCQGQDLQFSAFPSSGSWPSGTTFSWTGPQSYFTTLQHPTRANAQPAHSGNYTLVATANGCSSLAAVISVVVNPSPVPTGLSANTPLCEGQTLQLSVNPVPGGTYTWTGPQGQLISYLQNPTITNATPAMSGNYTVQVVSSNGCQNQGGGIIAVIVNPSAQVQAMSNSPVCEGGTILLTATSSIAGVSYSWTGPGFTSTVQNPTIFNAPLAAAGTYHVFVTANGCLTEDTVHVQVVPEPSAPVPTSNSAICAGETLLLFANGPTGANVTYAWTGPDPGNGTGPFTSTDQNPVIPSATVGHAGLYQVTVFVNGCPSPLGIVQVTVQPVPQISVTPTTATLCQGDSVTLVASGTGAQSYTWMPGGSNASSITVTPATTTTYTLSSLGSNGCYDVDTVQITVVPTPVANAGADQTGLCPSTSTTLAATPPPTGASGQWTILSGTGGVIANPTAANSGFSGTINTTYQLVWTVSQAPCASASDTVMVSFTTGSTPPQITLNNSPICVGQTLQLATALVPGATYTWTAPSGQLHYGQVLIITNTTIANNGPYTLTYTTAGGCTSQQAVVNFVVEPQPQTPLITSNSPVCVGQTLQLSTTATGVSYSWSGPAFFFSTDQYPVVQNVTAAHAGAYTLTVYSAAGCSSQVAVTNVVVNPAVAPVTATSNSPVCIGGTINLTAGGGYPVGSTYSWTGPNSFNSIQQNPTISSATAAMSGNYTVTVTVPTGCSPTPGVAAVTVHPAPVTPIAGATTPLCAGQTLTLSVSNPQGGATYNWTGPNNYAFTGVTATIPNAQAINQGPYQVTMVDQNGCVPAQGSTVQVVVNPAPTATAGSNSPLCVGQTLQLNVSQTPNATYSWTGPGGFTATTFNASIPNASTTNSGTYQVTVTANGCSTQVSVQVVVSPQPTAPVPTSNSPVCAGQPLILFVSNPVPGASYNWTGPDMFTSTQQQDTIAPATVAASGIYQVTVSVNGCTSAVGIHQVTVNPVPVVTVTASPAALCSTGGSATLQATGANSYSWAPAATLNTNTGTTVVATPSVTTTYTVYGYLSNNPACPSIDTIQVVVNTPPSADAGPDQLDLCGATTTLAAAVPVNGIGVWSITSGTGGSIATPDSATSSFTGQAGQSYVLTWTVSNAPCTAATSQVTISFQQQLLAPAATGDSNCGHGLPATLTATGAGANGIYQWYSDTTLAPVFTGASFTTPALDSTTTYYVSISNGGCQSGFVAVEAEVLELPVVEAGMGVTIEEGQSTVLMASGGVSYSWSPALGLTNPLTASPVASPVVTTLYTVTAEGLNGCSASDTVRVKVLPQLQIPNGFTPNGDGQNDVWELSALTEAYPECRVEVFNRWGGVVFRSTGYRTPWDGKHEGTHLPTATYYYIIYLKPGTAPVSGSVTIIR